MSFFQLVTYLVGNRAQLSDSLNSTRRPKLTLLTKQTGSALKIKEFIMPSKLK